MLSVSPTKSRKKYQNKIKTKLGFSAMYIDYRIRYPLPMPGSDNEYNLVVCVEFKHSWILDLCIFYLQFKVLKCCLCLANITVL